MPRAHHPGEPPPRRPFVKYRHAYLPGIPRNASGQYLIDSRLLESAGGLLRACKDDPAHPRHKPHVRAGKLLVDDERQRVAARARLEVLARQARDTFARLPGSDPEALGAQQDIRNLEHARDNIVTLQEASSPGGGLSLGKIYVVGHGARASSRLEHARGGPRRALQEVGRQLAELAMQRRWPSLDQRLSTCSSAEAPVRSVPAHTLRGRVVHRLEPAGHAAFRFLHQGARALLKQKASTISLYTYGYQGELTTDAARLPDAVAPPARPMTTRMHNATVLHDFPAPVGQQASHLIAPRFVSATVTQAREALSNAEKRYYSDRDDGLRRPGPFRPRGRRLSRSAVARLVVSGETTYVDEVGAMVVARASAFRRLLGGAALKRKR